MKNTIQLITVWTLLSLFLGQANAEMHYESEGIFYPTAAGMGLGYDISGTARMESKNKSKVKLEVSGLHDSYMYIAHVHEGGCGEMGTPEYGLGTPHYKFDATIIDTMEENEIWLWLYPNPIDEEDEETTAKTKVPFGVSGPISVVIHHGGTKIACATLEYITEIEED